MVLEPGSDAQQWITQVDIQRLRSLVTGSLRVTWGLQLEFTLVVAVRRLVFNLRILLLMCCKHVYALFTCLLKFCCLDRFFLFVQTWLMPF